MEVEAERKRGGTPLALCRARGLRGREGGGGKGAMAERARERDGECPRSICVSRLYPMPMLFVFCGGVVALRVAMVCYVPSLWCVSLCYVCIYDAVVRGSPNGRCALACKRCRESIAPTVQPLCI